MNGMYKSYVYHLINFDTYFYLCNPVSVKIENLTINPESFSVLSSPPPQKQPLCLFKKILSVSYFFHLQYRQIISNVNEA